MTKRTDRRMNPRLDGVACMRRRALRQVPRAMPLLLCAWLMVLPLPTLADEDPALIVIYDGLGTPARAKLWGRVIEDPGLAPATRDEGTLSKLRRTVSALESDEIEGARIEIEVLGKRHPVTSDEEGLFALELVGPLPEGNHAVKAQLPGSRRFRTEEGRLRIWPAKPGIAVVSDIDDTVLATGVTNKATMVGRVLTSNAFDLRTFDGAPALYRAFEARGWPVVFVSGSPQNLYSRLQQFLSLNQFPRSTLFLKNFGSDPMTEQIEYKLRRIAEAMALLPGYRLILVGDSGEKDPEIYRRVASKHRGLVLATFIHRVTDEPSTSARFKGQRLIARYAEAARALAALKLLPADDPHVDLQKGVEGAP